MTKAHIYVILAYDVEREEESMARYYIEAFLMMFEAISDSRIGR